jgi:hypothetical protein
MLILSAAALTISTISPALAAPFDEGRPSTPTIDFAKFCKEAQVHILARPTAPAKSIALDFSPRVRRELKTYYRLTPGGRILGTGDVDWYASRRDQTAYWEERNTWASDTSRPHYMRFQQKGPNTPIDSLSADILVVADISDPAELDNPVAAQGLVRYALTATDRRDGKLLGTMVYVIDMAHERACGANSKNRIDVEGFMLQAAAIPIVVPAWEVARRKRAAEFPMNLLHWLEE